MASYVGRIRVAGSLVAVWILALGVSAQTPPAQTPVPKIKSAVAIPIISLEGKDNFDAYCAVCHGKDGKGNGPAAPAMKVAVADLTTIAKRNNGKFPAVNVEFIIKGSGKTATPAHGVEDMPIWGEVFRSQPGTQTLLRIGNLVKYIQSIQVDAGSPPR